MVEYVNYNSKSSTPKTKIVVVSVVLPIILINIVVFILQMMFGPFMNKYFLLVSAQVWAEPWTLLTTTFMHGGFSHILFNMFGLFIFGPLLESKIGPKRFLGLYLSAGIISSFVGSFIYVSALGASGALMGIIGALIVLMPRLKIYLYFAIPMRLWFAGILFFIIDVFGTFSSNNVANIAHIVGMFIGLSYGYYLYSKRKKFQKKFIKKKTVSSSDAKEYKKLYK